MTAKQNLDIENALTLLQCGQTRRRAVGALDIDILYLAKGRPEFTCASLKQLASTIDIAKRRFEVYTDGDSMPYGGWAYDRHVYGGPVAIMNHFLRQPGTEIFAKIDNDVIVPPGWLEQCLAVMEAHPELDLLGIEPPASRTPNPHSSIRRVQYPEEGLTGTGYARCDSIGGIGLMRRSAFTNRPPMKPHGPNGVGGFTNWQTENVDVCKGWIVPPLKLFLLDRLPMEPWASLSKRYIAEGIQRPWTHYPASASHLWEWWLQRD